ncbi:uncharacterized protein Z518_00583 [Rhinocladiella mackenziei CBS 650.93]|uniref:Rhinocladiella mackenziei CBS 650.93 unplaced genomic scaffold supercont1.1, whole genome shotgun sequence n=1 Tax=Rhinocladiella mackenziei CBS 650.93 TaxID=1442369 RepID=A0A0D2HFU0_9EURO|nr:uncharacterized protein Z518_00583 [Rhinocladiella mackenziei CBS 650.93]KIX09503.1 hypothetical protein Z518_00583 [Rhinocladiella mackenziei CBS 650.93]
MPHTSHQKKSNHRKRKEVVDEEGWTRITSSSATCRGANHPSIADQSNEDKAVFRWNIRDRTVTKFYRAAPRPMNPAQGSTLESMRAQYRKIEAKWRESDLCHSLQKVLTTRILNTHSQISTCVVIGSGSFCGDDVHWIDRHESAYYQMAAFQTAVETIEQVQGHGPHCYAQEPCYNDLDTELLRSLNTTKVDHPAGFELLQDRTQTSAFVYSPFAEPQVELQIMFHNPRIWLHRSLDHMHREDRIAGDEEFTKDEAEVNLEMTDLFKRNHECAELPGLNVKNQPFHQSVIWWRKEDEIEQETAEPGAS